VVRADERVPGDAAVVRELSDGHGNFVAVVATRTVDAVFQGFVGQCLMFDEAKVEVFEEGRDAGEETDAFDAAGFGLIEDGLDEQTPGSVSFGVGADDDGAEFGKVLAVDVKGSTADELAGGGFDYGEGVDVCADLCVWAMEKGAIVGEAVDEVIDGASIVQLRFTGLQGCSEFVCRWNEGGYE
jgi:hypothetical protein